MLGEDLTQVSKCRRYSWLQPEWAHVWVCVCGPNG